MLDYEIRRRAEADRKIDRLNEIEAEKRAERAWKVENDILDIITEIEDGDRTIEESRAELSALIEEAEEFGVDCSKYCEMM